MWDAVSKASTRFSGYWASVQTIREITARLGITAASPILIMVFFVLVEKRFPKKEEVLVLATVIVGIFLLATHGSIKNLVITNAALFWGLLSAFAFAVYNVQPKKLLDEFGTLETTGWGMFVGGVLVTPFTKVWSVPGHWDIMTVATILSATVLGQAFGMIDVVGILCIVGAVTALTVVDA